MDANPQITKVGVIGVGNMGSMFSLLLADKGFEVSIYDASEQNVQRTMQKAAEAGLKLLVHDYLDIASFCQNLGPSKVIFFSLPHGAVIDSVLEGLRSHLSAGDIIVDGSNESYLSTEKRQVLLKTQGVDHIGMGISGGYQGARYGPSLSPGGEDAALSRILPILLKIAAKDSRGTPCVAKIGPGGSGHYVKMIHNGIEHGIMSVLSEVWAIMSKGMRMDGDEIGSLIEKWGLEGELKNNFLVQISAPICRTRDLSGSGYVLDNIRDTVVQDADGSEGTGCWSNLEAISLHVSTPSLAAAHHFRIASSDAMDRARVQKLFGETLVGDMRKSGASKREFLRALREATYVAVLACFIQGMTELAKASERKGWRLDFPSILGIWRAGCIIRSDGLMELLERLGSGPETGSTFIDEAVALELRKNYASLRTVVIRSTEADASIPCLSATLEYLKYFGSTDLPLAFMEAQMDFFGAHGFDLKSDPISKIAKGTHHGNWLSYRQYS